MDTYSFEQLDISLGMEYALNKKPFYIDTLEIYLEETAQSEIELKEFMDAGDMQNYAISVHALKSNSRIVGAVEMGNFAESMERSSKAGALVSRTLFPIWTISVQVPLPVQRHTISQRTAFPHPIYQPPYKTHLIKRIMH